MVGFFLAILGAVISLMITALGPSDNISELPTGFFYIDNIDNSNNKIENYAVDIILSPEENSNNVWVRIFIDAQSKSIGDTITIYWPGMLSIYTISSDQQAYSVDFDGSKSRIKINGIESSYPQGFTSVDFNWINGSNNFGIFRRRLFLRLGNILSQAVFNRDGAEQSGDNYVVSFTTLLPSNKRLNFEYPSSSSFFSSRDPRRIDRPIKVKTTTAFQNSKFRTAEGDFLLVYEDYNYSEKITMINILIGLLFGLSGNIFAGIILYIWLGSS
jgi:hypothetical protein